MRIPKTIAAVTLVSAVALGGVGVASAQTPSADPSFTVEVSCADARARVDRMETRLATVEERLVTATAKRDELASAGRSRLADRLTSRIDAANDRLPVAQARVERLAALIAEKCPTA